MNREATTVRNYGRANDKSSTQRLLEVVLKLKNKKYRKATVEIMGNSRNRIWFSVTLKHIVKVQHFGVYL